MITYILTDIEGTTTDILFVHKVLFPYSYQKLPNFVRAHVQDEQVAACIKETQQSLLDEKGLHADLNLCIEALLDWISDDRKHPALKRLQGMIWRAGYKSGAFKGHLYPDVAPQLQRWRAKNMGIGVYSSGSVEAQQLLFGYSEYGDLTNLFDHFFDTAMGHKKESQSYQNIIAKLEISSGNILFLSDVEAELDAARAAGMHTTQLLRAGGIPSLKHPVAADFSEVENMLHQF